MYPDDDGTDKFRAPSKPIYHKVHLKGNPFDCEYVIAKTSFKAWKLSRFHSFPFHMVDSISIDRLSPARARRLRDAYES